jgi:hypothetical protein
MKMGALRNKSSGLARSSESTRPSQTAPTRLLSEYFGLFLAVGYRVHIV